MIDIVGALAELIRQDGIDLLFGSTIVLGVFALLVAASRSPANKHRLASAAFPAVAIYTAMALAPLPRLDLAPARGTASTLPAPHRTNRSLPRTAPAHSQPTAPDESTATVRPRPTQPRVDGSPTADVIAGASIGPRAASSVPALPARDLAWWFANLLLVGASLFGCQLLIGWLRLFGILRRSKPVEPMLRQLADLPTGVRVLVSDDRIQPFCCSVWRPTIVLPTRMARATAETRFVLLHEAAHLRSGDARMRTLAALLRPLLYWHPLFWWLHQQLRFTGELLADDDASRGAIADYVRCMMALARESTPPRTGVLVATVFHRRSELFRRLEMMLKRDAVLSRSQSSWQRCLRATAAAAVVLLSAGMFGVRPAAAQDPDQRQELRREVERLRATIHELQAELTALTALRAEAVAKSPPARVGAQPSRDLPAIGVGGGSGGATATPPAPNSFYRVQAGDTLAHIARELGMGAKGVETLRRLNPQADPSKLRVGQRLRIVDPPADVAVAPRAPLVASATARSDGSLTGLAGLVTRCIELRGEVEIQSVEVDYAKTAAANGVADKRELQIAMIRLRTKEAQYKAISDMLRAELERAERELERSRLLQEKGYISAAEATGVESRIQLLRSALR